MKFRWSIRKDSAFSLLGLAFGLLALIFSLITARFTNYLDFRLPNFLFNNGKQVASSVRIMVHALCAASLLITGLCQCFGFGKGGILVSSVLLFCSSVGNLGTDLYVALYVDGVAFYPFSLRYLDVLLSCLLLILVVLTYLRVVRTTVPAIVVGFASSITVSVLTILRVGCYGTLEMVDFSSMLFYLCACVALSLCFIAWRKEDNSVLEQATPAPSAAVAAYSDEPTTMAEPEVSPETEVFSDAVKPDLLQETDVTPQVLQPDIPTQSDEPAQPDLSTQPDVPVPPDIPAPPAAQNAMPLPMEGYIWTQIGFDPDGSAIFAQRRIFTDAKTGRQISGPFAQVFYPHPPTAAMRPPVHTPQPAVQPPVAPPMQQPDNSVQQINVLLQQLSMLHDQGILTDAEYSEKCKQLLNRI